jgi:hypothetical protein
MAFAISADPEFLSNNSGMKFKGYYEPPVRMGTSDIVTGLRNTTNILSGRSAISVFGSLETIVLLYVLLINVLLI